MNATAFKTNTAPVLIMLGVAVSALGGPAVIAVVLCAFASGWAFRGMLP